MARTSSLNKYLSNTPYAVLSLEALEEDQMEALFLSLENEANRVQALRSTLTTIQNVKGINREIALSLEELDEKILPFKPAGFTTAPSKTGLVLTQESLGRAIADGAKRVWEVILDLLRRIGTALGVNKTAARAAKDAARRMKAIKEEDFARVFTDDVSEELVLNVARAGTVDILRGMSKGVKDDLAEQSNMISNILTMAASKNGQVDRLVAEANRYDMAFRKTSMLVGTYGVRVDFTTPAEELNRNYMMAVEEQAQKDAKAGAVNYRLWRAGTAIKNTAGKLEEVAEKNDQLADELARANEKANRIIRQAQASGSDWFGPDLVSAVSRIYRSQMKMFSLMRGHMHYCTIAINKVNERLDDVRKEVV